MDDKSVVAPPAATRRRHTRETLARRLRLVQLMVFERTAAAGSILAASRELAMTQPAVSKSLQELEEHLGEKLFMRGRRGVSLTDFGRMFERHARAVLAELHDMADDINATQSGSIGKVIVGTLITASTTLLPDAIIRLRLAVPEVAVITRVGPNSTLFPALARGELDVVVGLVPEGQEAQHYAGLPLAHVPLYRETLSVVVGGGHPLAGRDRIDREALRTLDWIIPTRDAVSYPAARRFFEAMGLEMPRNTVESIAILTNLGLLANSTMAALMPQSVAERFIHDGLLARLPINMQEAYSTVGYTVRIGLEPAPTTRRFLEALRAAAGGLEDRGPPQAS